MIIGTAGHVDHGKTALVRALTGIDTDRLKEEKLRGISIDLGFAYWSAGAGETLGFVDVPGHERFIHNMLAGATGVDFILLVVAADDGVMMQTREHLAIVDLLGIRQGIVALTKTDLVDAARLAECRREITDVLSGTYLSGVEIVEASAVTGKGLQELRERLVQAGERFTRRAADGRFRLAVDRAFSLKGIGTVVTGSVLSGQVAVEDRVVVSPSGLSARVRSIHAQNQVAGRGIVGDRCAINLAGEGVSKDAIARGDVLVDPSLHCPADRIDAHLRVLSAETKPLAQWTPVRLHHAANEVGARIVLLGDQPAAPGTETFVQLVLERPVAAASGDRFIVRDTSAQRTIGGGVFLDLRAPARKRRTPERRAQLTAHLIDNPKRALAKLLECAGGFMDIIAFATDRALSSAQLDAIAGELQLVRIAVGGTSYAALPSQWESFAEGIGERLRAFHSANPDRPGIELSALRLSLQPRLQAAVFAGAVQELARRGTTEMEGGLLRLAGHAAVLPAADRALWDRVEPMLGGAERFRPPRVRDLAALLSLNEADVRRVMKHQAKSSRIYEIAKDHFFLRGVLAEAAEIITELAEAGPNGEFTLAQLRDRLDNGRKVAIQILEFFDRQGATLRRGDNRRINAHRMQNFHAWAPTGGSENLGGEALPVERPDFKSGRGRQPVLGGFDPHSPPPTSRK